MDEYLKNPEAYKNFLIKRLDGLLTDTIIQISPHDRVRIRGNCNEIELQLMYLFGMRQSQFDLLEEKVGREEEYYKLKYGGYSLTGDDGDKHFIDREGKRVEPAFRLVDNGLGDVRAVKAAYEFQKWLKETGVTGIDWMLEADIIPPSLTEVEGYDFEEYKDILEA